MPRKLTLEQFADLLKETYGADMPQLVREDALSIKELRERLGLVFSRDAEGNLDIEQY